MYARPVLSEKHIYARPDAFFANMSAVMMIKQLFLLAPCPICSIAIICACTFAYARGCIRLSRSLSLARPQLRVRHSHCVLSFVVQENCCDFLERFAARVLQAFILHPTRSVG